MNLRRVPVGSLTVSLIAAGCWSWRVAQPASLASFLIAAAIIFFPIFALRVIIDVGGRLLEDDLRTKRRAGIDDRNPWA